MPEDVTLRIAMLQRECDNLRARCNSTAAYLMVALEALDLDRKAVVQERLEIAIERLRAV